MNRIIHSPACDKLMSEWYGLPHDSVEHRLTGFVYRHTDAEIRDELLTIFDEDPPDCAAVAAARKLWPLLVFGDPIHEPEDLLDELDEAIRDYDALRLRIEALAAKYRALEPWSNRWNRSPHPEPTFGELNIDWTVRELDGFASSPSGTYQRERLAVAREKAAKLRDYSAEVTE